MCRIFAFRSVIPSKVHTSLVAAENALMAQSSEHPNGWGLAYFLEGAPHVVKAATSAMNDHFFHLLSGVVSSETVVAHIRKATVGESSITNTHPFQYGSWIFVHNGNIKNFTEFRQSLRGQVDPSLQPFILGDTDSELIFYIVLSQLKKVSSLKGSVTFATVLAATKNALQIVTDIVGPYSSEDGSPDLTYLSFVLTNGEAMIIHQGGKELYYSTYKTRCPDRDNCRFFSVECEAPPPHGYVNHLVVSSEPIGSENVWILMKPGQILGIDSNMLIDFLPAVS